MRLATLRLCVSVVRFVRGVLHPCSSVFIRAGIDFDTSSGFATFSPFEAEEVVARAARTACNLPTSSQSFRMPAAPIHAVDERVLPFAPEQIWPVLADVTASPRWWPTSIRLTVLNASPGLIGSELEVCPRGGRPFRCRVEAIEPPRRMQMRYGNGFVTGTGEWRLEAVAGGTRVAYALDVQAHGWLVALLGKLLPLGKIHSKSMQELLAKLEVEVRDRF